MNLQTDHLSYRYTKRQRLTKADEFSSVFSLHCLIHCRYVQAFIRPNGLVQARLGIVVAKHIARQAIKRNYMKRVIREYFRLHAAQVDGFDIVIRVKQPFCPAEGALAREALKTLWKKINRCPA